MTTREPGPTIDVVVIGAGLAGLAAAITAQGNGRRTLLLDAHQPGGRAQSVDHDGYVFNLGAHALYRGGAAMETLTALGIHPEGAIPDSTSGQGERGDLIDILPGGPSSLLRTKLLSSRAKWAFGKVFLRLPRLDAATFADRSTAEFIDDLRLTPDARRLVEMMVRLTCYVADPAALSADAAIAQIQMALADGVLYLHGGWQRMVDQMRVRFEELGGVMRTGTPVSSVRATHDGAADDGAVTVVTSRRTTSDDPIVAASAVIACGGPAAAAALLDSDPGWADQLGPQVDASCLSLGLHRPPEARFVLGVGRPLYLSTHSPVADLAPPGGAVVELLKYLDGRPTTADQDRAELEAFAARTGIGVDDIVTRRFLRRMMVTGGTPRGDRGGLRGRPGVAVAGSPTIFVAGDWVGPDGMLADASLASGRAAGSAAARSAEARAVMVPSASATGP